MKKTVIAIIALFATTWSSYAFADDVMKRQADGTCIVNTTTLCTAKGFKAQTPVEVYIKNGKVLKVVPLANKESKGYFSKVQKGLLPQYEGLKVAKAKKLAAKQKIDAVTGATYSTKAVQKNIQTALDYYQKHK